MPINRTGAGSFRRNGKNYIAGLGTENAQRKVTEMFRFRQQSKPDKQNAQQSNSEKERTPVTATNDPYVVNIVRMLEELRKEKKH